MIPSHPVGTPDSPLQNLWAPGTERVRSWSYRTPSVCRQEPEVLGRMRPAHTGNAGARPRPTAPSARPFGVGISAAHGGPSRLMERGEVRGGGRGPQHTVLPTRYSQALSTQVAVVSVGDVVRTTDGLIGDGAGDGRRGIPLVNTAVHLWLTQRMACFLLASSWAILASVG